MTKIHLRLLVVSLFSAFCCSATQAASEKTEALLPLKPEVRKILDQSCVMCHGEVIAGKAEIREDLDLSSDDAIRETLTEPGRLKEMLVKDKMPQKAKLSFRLRKDPQMHERLTSIKESWNKNGEKDVLLAWLKDVVATETPEKDE